MEHSQRYQLGSWVICPQSNTITNKADTHSIENKSMQVLLFLILHSGEQVTKGQIFEHVWKDSFVADDILSVAVSKIRKALGDNARSPTFIKTLPGVGYTLIAKVKKLDKPEQERSKKIDFSSIYKPNITIGIITLLLIATSLTMYFINTNEDSLVNRININSIAVLPFDDLSSTQDNQHFTDGLSDAIINQLSQIKQLKVSSRYSSFTFRGKYNATEIGQSLKVDALLDGSVQTMGEQVRINVRIFSTKDGQQLWSKTFDSENEDIFTLQDNISDAIQETIQLDYVAKNSIGSPTQTKKINPQAYEWYLMGQYHWRQRNPISLSKAVTYFEHSLALEPEYADAHIGLAITYGNLHHYANWSEKKSFDKSLPHLEKALALKPNSPITLATQGMLLTLKAGYETGFADADSALIQQAHQAFLSSLALDDNATTHRWYSLLLEKLGNESQVIQHMNNAIKLNPLSAPLKRSLSKYLHSIGKPDSAQRMYQRALILEPNHLSHVVDSTHVFRNTRQSITAMAEWHSANADIFTNCSSVEYCEQLVLAYLSIGATDVANNILANMRARHGHFVNSLNLIKFGSKGEEQSILSIKERSALRRPNNRRVLFDLAVAQFRTEKFKQAKTSLLQLKPEWHSPTSVELDDINADSYVTLVLYAVTLSKLGEKEIADNLLHSLQTFLKQKTVFDKIQAEFTLAEINAQLGNVPQSLLHLATALEMGWLETYDREWWSLQSNHLLRPLLEEPEFKLLLKQHREKLNELRAQVIRKLSTISSSME
ncbi:winged helix-turn-helix domain-containing protein [Colwellia psychrerythraea]|uniref:Transcriptional regulator domain-containing protein n=1 Tax=Colwellia psychrerythraea TaxID=28229 RepID=A0A099KSB0_COLPS|nr:winged helix-turn-helix domain-containing protein [Colwellia psychrerythraea]KGJ93431.1 transcriptional regulator domain-containing protein [Colwellia psychrerythraea]